MSEYDPKKIERKWQEIWLEDKVFQVSDSSEKKKLYVLVEFPYPSGDGLHVGHTRSYTALDAYARKKRLEGFSVLYPIGYDAFGLPTENYAIKTGVSPKEVTENNIVIFRRQMKSMGFSFDWSREINTTDPNYYKWTQWIFLQFYKHGIIDGKLVEIADDDKTTSRFAYQDEIPINWCPSCKIGLANEEVVGGKCERCHAETEKRMQKQWMLRITAYADRLIDDLSTVDYLEKIKTGQINWIGRSEGSDIIFGIKGTTDAIKVFTTRTDTLFGCTYVVLAPEHELVKKLKSKIENFNEVKRYIGQAKKKSDLERIELAKEKTGVALKGIKAINPINNKEVSIWVADYVLAHYGTGAVMAVPAHDERDFEFAKKYGIEIPYVIFPADSSKIDQSKAFIEYGILKNSASFDGLSSNDAKKKITEKLKSGGRGDFSVNYKLRDWVFSRQHYWGEPIPLIHCPKCGIVPVPDDQLPIKLPDVENYQPSDTGQSPLSNISDWLDVKCPKCGGNAKRETDTMPNWAGSSWYFLRYCDPNNNQYLADRSKLDFWLPVDVYNGGMEHTTLHLLYSRFWYKFLSDLGLVPGVEPYKKRVAHGMILGADNQKMSKSLGNVVNPDSVVEKYGTDTLRTYILFIGPYDDVAPWNPSSISGASRFLKRFWQISKFISNKEPESVSRAVNIAIKKVSEDLDNFHFNTIVSTIMGTTNIIYKEENITKESLGKLLIIFYPLAPHICAEMYDIVIGENIVEAKWPEYDQKYIVESKIEIPVQINGKVRDKLTVTPGISEDEIKKMAFASEKIKEWTKNQLAKKIIYIKDKILSIVV